MRNGSRSSVGPRLSVGQALTAWSCQRHASLLLDPESPRARASDGAFRLGNAIAAAVIDAHRIHGDTGRPENGLSDALSAAQPPPELGHEEAVRFRIALDAYEEAWGSDADANAIQLHARADTPLTAAIGHSGVTLTGSVKLAFSAEHGEGARRAGTIIVRSVAVGPTPTAQPDRRGDALRLIALGAAEGDVQRLTVSPHGGATLTSQQFDHTELRHVFREVGDMVDAAVAAGPNAVATSGWWCAGCSFVRNCPAVSAVRLVDMLEAYPR